MVTAVIILTAVIFYFDRTGLIDQTHPDKPLDIIGVIYFTIVTVTTLGYGDIVPITSGARLFNAIFVTGVRIFTYLIILTTTFELTLPKMMEGLMIKKLIDRTKDHIIICGLGKVGQEILENTLAQGQDPKQIVVVDIDEDMATLAAEKGVAALRGNAEKEEILRMADVKNARKIYLCADQDHTNIMIGLTARSMSDKVQIVALAREKENVKLFRNSGATRIISLPELLSKEMLKDSDGDEPAGGKDSA